MTPPITIPESLKSIDSLKDKHQKLTPQILEELKALLQKKYGIDTSKEIFNISSEELEMLKWELESSVSPKETVERFLYDEYLKTQIETKWLSAVSIETATSWIESNRLNEMKSQFEGFINPMLNKYDFLDTNSKNVIKLALANKLISSESWWQTLSVLSDLKTSVEDLNMKSLWDLADTAWKKVDSKDSIQSGFEQILNPYIAWFEKINSKLNEYIPKLTPEQKQNIIWNINYFRNPEIIESGFDEKILSEITIENKDKKVSNNLSNEEQKKLKLYLIASRSKIEDIAHKFEWWEKVLDLALNAMSYDWFLWDASKDILSFLLKIPFLWGIIAMFLWLNKDNPMDDLNEQASLYKIFKSFKNFGIQMNKNWKKTDWEWAFKNIDLSEIKYGDIKPELKEITKMVWNKNIDEFWEESFHDGTEINWVLLKFEISNEIRKDWKITSKEWREIIKNGLNTYNKSKQKQEWAAKKEETEKKQQEAVVVSQQNKEKAWNIDSQIKNIDSVINKDYEKVTNWSNIIWASINDLDVSKIVNNTGDEFKTILIDTIWESKYKALLSEHYGFLDNLLLQVKDYCKIKSISGWKLKDFLKTSLTDFHVFLNNKKTPLVKEQEELRWKISEWEKVNGKIMLAKKVGETISKVETKTSISWNSLENISFSKDSQKIKIWENFYNISVMNDGQNYKLTDIVIAHTWVTFEVDAWILAEASWKNKTEVEKDTIIEAIQTLVTTDSYEYNTGETKMTLKKST